MSWQISVESPSSAFPVVRLSSTLSPAERAAGRKGALRAAENVLGAAARLAATRCQLAGLAHPAHQIAGWRAVLQIPRSDLDAVTAALEALVAGDSDPLRAYAGGPAAKM